MIETLRKLLLGSILTPASVMALRDWLIANKTGGSRLRAGLPKDWITGDKTGSGENGTANDIAVTWPPRRSPIFVAAYLTQASGSVEDENAVLAKVGRAIAAEFMS